MNADEFYSWFYLKVKCILCRINILTWQYSLHPGRCQSNSRGFAFSVLQMKVTQCQFLLDCVTFQVWHKEDKPNPVVKESWPVHFPQDSFTLSCRVSCEKKKEMKGNKSPHTAVTHVYSWAWSLKFVGANKWLCMHADSRSDLLMSSLRKWLKTAGFNLNWRRAQMEKGK